MAPARGCPSMLLVTCTLCLVLLPRSGAEDAAGQDEPYSCAHGCRKAFKPVCGADGRTYSSPCLATCQGVAVSQHGPCPGEQMLHPDNAHIVTGASSSTAASFSSHHSAATTVTPHHLSAFAHEGYRYAGQLAFTSELAPRHGGRGGAGQRQPPSQRAGSTPRDAEAAPLRALRITREGHVYLADIDESVEAVVDALIDQHAASAAASSSTASGSSSSPSAASASATASHGLLHSLRQWREYRPAGRRDGSGSGGKWKRHAAVADSRTGAGVGTGVPGEHVLQPVLENSGGVGAVSSAVQNPYATTSQTAKQRQEQQAVAAGDSEPHGQARRSLGVFDTDDRLDCPRSPTYPFTAVGQINVRDVSGNYVCSGALVGPDVVLTAAHCVFNRAAQAFYDKLDFAPGRYRALDGSVVNPFGVVPWNYVTVYQSYSTAATPDPNTVDIAVIKLTERVGLQSGWMGVFEPCSAAAPSRYVALTAGYPSDQAPGSCKTTQCVVSQEPCTDGYLYHKCDTASGQSGSPMYMMAMANSRKMGPFVRAVHNIEWVQEMPNGKSVSYINSAVSITPDHYRTILAWIAPSFTNTSSSTPMGPALPPPASVSGR